MRMTAEGLDLIRHHEGFRADAYRCPAGVWTIGYGHTSAAGPPAVRPGMTISEAEALAVLAADVKQFEAGVRASLRRPLGEQQFSALVSFAYNVGIGNFRTSSVLKAVNAGDDAAVPRRLQLWVKGGGRVLPGLVKRRAAEAALFVSAADAGTSPDPSPDPVQGKPVRRSSTVLAAVLAALASVLSAVAQGRGTGSNASVVLLAIVTVAAAVWIIAERRKKSQEDGL